MTHTAALFLLLLAWLCVRSALDGRAVRLLFVAGLAMGWMVLVRPLDGLLMGVMTGLFVLNAAARRREVSVAALGAYAVGCLATGSLLLLHAALVTGDPMTMPMESYIDRIWYPGANRLGFGGDVGNPPGGWGPLDPTPGHGLLDVLLNTNQNLYNLNFELFGWSTGSLLFVVAFLVLGRPARLDRQFLVLLLALALALNLYWFSGGPDFGARYWFLMIVPLLWLTLRGLAALSRTLLVRFSDPHAAARLGIVCSLLLAGTVLLFIPWRIAFKYEDYRGFHGDFRRLLEEGAFEGAPLVLVEAPKDTDWASAFLLNDPDLPAGQPVFARALSEEVEARLRQAFPDRPVVRVLGRSAPGEGVRVRR